MKFILALSFLGLVCFSVAQVDVGGGQAVAACPSSTPIRCPNSQCVTAVANCPANNCSGTTPYQCSDGGCAVSSIYCGCVGVICADGSCKATMSQCPILGSCSELLPKRCGDGTCQAWNSACTNHTGPTCPSQLTKCIDGICRIAELCAALPFYGCPSFECPDGTCVTSYSACQCTGQPTKVKCFDGSCVLRGTKCAISAPAFTYPMNLTYTVNTSDSNTVSVPSSSNTSQNIATITLPPNSVNGTLPGANSTTMNTVTVGGVAAGTANGTTVIDPATGQATPAQLLTPPVNVNFGNGQSQLNNGSTAAVTFENVPPQTNGSTCVAYLNTTTGVWSCNDNSVTNGTNVTSNVGHFSIYAVIVRPSCVSDGAEAAPAFCARQVFNTTWGIGYYCTNRGASFYMCWSAPNTIYSSKQNCPTGTKCSCCSSDECSANNTLSPCR